MDPSSKKKNKHSVKSSHTRVKSSKSSSSNFWKVCSFFKSNLIVTSLVLVLLGTFVLKYYEDVHYAYSNFKRMDVDIYKVLEVSRDSKESEIKSKYRELSMKWHPDKNKDCPDCEEKFLKIKEAYKIILNPYLREMYDKTKGHTVDMIPSKTTSLTLSNYDKLVKNSTKVWVVQVYSDDNHSCKSFAPLWDEFATKFEKFAKFGRVNALLDEKLLNKLPSKPQIYPSIFFLFPDKHHDLVPLNVMDNLKNLSKYFSDNYPFYGTKFEDYSKFRVFEGPKLLLYSETKDLPLSLKFVALKFHKVLKVFFVSNGEHYSKDELLLEDMKDAESLPKVPDKLELYNLFVGLYKDRFLKYFSYQLKNNLQSLEKAVYSLLSMETHLYLNNNTYDSLCSRYNIKERVCVFVPDGYKVMELSNVYNKYENFHMVLNPDDANTEEKMVSTVDLQFLKYKNENKSFQQLFTNFYSKSKEHFDSDKPLLLVNKNKQVYTVVNKKNLNEEFVDDLLTGSTDLKWVPLPNSCKGDLFKYNCLNYKNRFLFPKLLSFY